MSEMIYSEKLLSALPSSLGENIVELEFSNLAFKILTAGRFIDLAKAQGQRFEFEVIDTVINGATYPFIANITKVMEVEYKQTDGMLHLSSFIKTEEITLDLINKSPYGDTRFIKVFTEVTKLENIQGAKGTKWFLLNLLTRQGTTIQAKLFKNMLKEAVTAEMLAGSYLQCDIVLDNYGYKIENIHSLLAGNAREVNNEINIELDMMRKFLILEYRNLGPDSLSITDLIDTFDSSDQSVKGYPIMFLAFAKMYMNTLSNSILLDEQVYTRVCRCLVLYSLIFTAKKKLNMDDKTLAVVIATARRIGSLDECEIISGSGIKTVESEILDEAIQFAKKTITKKLRWVEVE